jgi:hypothetical protein
MTNKKGGNFYNYKIVTCLLTTNLKIKNKKKKKLIKNKEAEDQEKIKKVEIINVGVEKHI